MVTKVIEHHSLSLPLYKCVPQVIKLENFNDSVCDLAYKHLQEVVYVFYKSCRKCPPMWFIVKPIFSFFTIIHAYFAGLFHTILFIISLMHSWIYFMYKITFFFFFFYFCVYITNIAFVQYFSNNYFFRKAHKKK